VFADVGELPPHSLPVRLERLLPTVSPAEATRICFSYCCVYYVEKSKFELLNVCREIHRFRYDEHVVSDVGAICCVAITRQCYGIANHFAFTYCNVICYYC
jgi:hypothetical protein